MSYPDIIVSGAGSSEVNGTYVYDSMYLGKPKYKFGDTVLCWEGEGVLDFPAWQFYDLNDPFWTFSYFSYDDFATPDLCTTWEQRWGDSPVPTVTAAGGGDPSGTLRRTNMNAQMSNLTGGMHG